MTEITGRETLTGGGQLEESLERRDPYIDPPNLLQVQLLGRDRNELFALDKRTLRLTVEDIAAGVKNIG